MQTAVRATVLADLESHGIPILGSQASSGDAPVLQVSYSQFPAKDPASFTVSWEIDLLELARLISDPRRVVWSSMWEASQPVLPPEPSCCVSWKGPPQATFTNLQETTP